MDNKFLVKNFYAWYGKRIVLQNISLKIKKQQVTSIIGPSGCGKSTFIRCLNRMHEMNLEAKVSGSIFLDEQEIYAKQIDPVLLRRRVGMVFQKPNPFYTMSIFNNVISGLKLTHSLKKSQAANIVEAALTKSALWDEVKDRLSNSAESLSGGQQQRLCIARALAVEPEVLLMDEPCSALDPIATSKIEELIRELRDKYTIIIVTHNMQQAARVADSTAFFLNGELIEHAQVGKIFTNPSDSRTEDYITGKFG
jgi:phosphate transport system ATP-binding protein